MRLITRLLIYVLALVAVFVGLRGLLTDSTTPGWLELAAWLLLGAASLLEVAHRRIRGKEAGQA